MNTIKFTGAALLVSAAMIGSAFAQAPGSPMSGPSGSSVIDRAPSGQTPAGGSAGAGPSAMPAPQASAPQARGGMSADRGARAGAGMRVDSNRVATNQWRGDRDRQWRDGRWRDRNWRGPTIGFGIGFGPSYGYYGDSYAYYGGPTYSGTTYYAESSGDDAYCSQRYRSYDPASGTYLGYDGMRHPCP